MERPKMRFCLTKDWYFFRLTYSLKYLVFVEGRADTAATKRHSIEIN